VFQATDRGRKGLVRLRTGGRSFIDPNEVMSAGARRGGSEATTVRRFEIDRCRSVGASACIRGALRGRGATRSWHQPLQRSGGPWTAREVTAGRNVRLMNHSRGPRGRDPSDRQRLVQMASRAQSANRAEGGSDSLPRIGRGVDEFGLPTVFAVAGRMDHPSGPRAVGDPRAAVDRADSGADHRFEGGRAHRRRR